MLKIKKLRFNLSFIGWVQNPDVINIKENAQTSVAATTQITSLDNSSPRPHRKLHPFKSIPKKNQHQQQQSGTPPGSPTLPGRKLK